MIDLTPFAIQLLHKSLNEENEYQTLRSTLNGYNKAKLGGANRRFLSGALLLRQNSSLPQFLNCAKLVGSTCLPCGWIGLSVQCPSSLTLVDSIWSFCSMSCKIGSSKCHFYALLISLGISMVFMLDSFTIQ